MTDTLAATLILALVLLIGAVSLFGMVCASIQCIREYKRLAKREEVATWETQNLQ